MVIVTSPIAAPQQASAPIVRADLRPTADTAALIRNPQPSIPLPIPASSGQNAVVVQTKLSLPADTAQPVDRVLKPYGVTMLPHGPKPDDVKAESEAKTEAEDDVTVQDDTVTGSDPTPEVAISPVIETDPSSADDAENPAKTETSSADPEPA
ncbi:hypothetical protein [Loktanella sp. R86503]|uniref:hypothetical protein n=1 Tax=Loktanella sp. R86503 TaxID=3093847 RepID=UPI0036DE3B35